MSHVALKRVFYMMYIILSVVIRWDAWHEICQARATHITQGRRPRVIWIARAWQQSINPSHWISCHTIPEYDCAPYIMTTFFFIKMNNTATRGSLTSRVVTSNSVNRLWCIYPINSAVVRYLACFCMERLTYFTRYIKTISICKSM